MDKKSNFRKAYSELASMVGIDAPPEAGSVPDDNMDLASTQRITDELFGTMEETVSPKSTPVTTSVTTISADTSITGDIAAGSLDIFGSITGNVTAKGSVLIRGNVTGNITADSVTIESGTIHADVITATGKVEIATGANLSTNIQCGNIIVHSHLKGNLMVTGSCVLCSSATIEGNITAASLSVSSGATIKGLVEITP